MADIWAPSRALWARPRFQSRLEGLVSQIVPFSPDAGFPSSRFLQALLFFLVALTFLSSLH